MEFATLSDVSLSGKRVLIREDFNVPMQDGRVLSDARLVAALPTIQRAINEASQVCLISHLGRPDRACKKYSLRPIAELLQILLGRKVEFVEELQAIEAPLVLYENVRFFAGETQNNTSLAKRMASLGDIFVMDAFASAHRAHASTVGAIEFSPRAVAGPLLSKEVQALDQIMNSPRRPLVAIIGGSKVSSKLEVLSSLLPKVDNLIIGGGMANTFFAAQGMDVGNSLYEPSLMLQTQKLLNSIDGHKIILPTDMIWDDGKIMDIGEDSRKLFSKIIRDAATIVWNGPMGVFENQSFAAGTLALAYAVAKSKAYSVAGGGDTLAALDKLQLGESINYISTGGGAFLEYIEGKTLPSIKALIAKSKYGIKTY